MLFSFRYPPTVSCRTAAPSSWKEVKSVTGFSLTEFPVVSYFLLHLITCNPKWFMCVCVCVCGALPAPVCFVDIVIEVFIQLHVLSLNS